MEAVMDNYAFAELQNVVDKTHKFKQIYQLQNLNYRFLPVDDGKKIICIDLVGKGINTGRAVAVMIDKVRGEIGVYEKLTESISEIHYGDDNLSAFFKITDQIPDIIPNIVEGKESSDLIKLFISEAKDHEPVECDDNSGFW